MESVGDDYKRYKPRFLQEWTLTIADLDTLAIQNKPRDSAPEVVVVFLHGYGSNTKRTKKIAEYVLNHCFLTPTSRFLQPHDTHIPTVLFLIPQAPNEMVGNNVFYWWELPNIGLIFAFGLTALGHMQTYYPKAELEQLRCTLNRYLEAVDSSYGSDTKLILGGFSQGSILAADLMLHRSYFRQPDMLILMSTTQIEKAVWESQQTLLQGRGECIMDCYVLQTHGYRDIVLNYGAAKTFFSRLCDYNAGRTELFSFDGGHDMTISARHHVAERIRDFVYRDEMNKQ